MVIHIAIGNSDDKLTQVEWSRYYRRVALIIQDNAAVRHGQWVSEPASAWQNACWCIEVRDASVERELRHLLALAAADFGQESIAWNKSETEFITPGRPW